MTEPPASRTARIRTTCRSKLWRVCRAPPIAAGRSAAFAALHGSPIIAGACPLVGLLLSVCGESEAERTAGRAGALHRRAFRAVPRAVFAVTAIRLQSLTPTRLRRCALRLPPGGSARGPSPPRCTWRPLSTAEPACAGSARPPTAGPPLRAGLRPRSSARPCCIRARWQS